MGAKLKNIFSISIVLLFTLNLFFTYSVYAGEVNQPEASTKILIEDKEVYTGSEFIINVVLKNVKELGVLEGTTYYDKNYLTLLDITLINSINETTNDGSLKSVRLVESNKETGKFSIVDTSGIPNDTVVVKLRFRTASGLSEGKITEIMIKDIVANYVTLEPYAIDLQRGMITIKPYIDAGNGSDNTDNTNGNGDEDDNSEIITVSEIDKLIKDLPQDLPTGNKKAEKPVIEIKIQDKLDNTKTKVSMQKAAIENIAKVDDLKVRLDMPLAQIEFDNKALDTIAKKAIEDVDFSVEKLEIENIIKDLPPQQQGKVREKVEDRPVYNFGVTSGTEEISHFNGGKATITLPYTLKVGEKPNNVVVYYLDSKGKLKQVNGRYDENTKSVIIKLTHFSTYVIGYNEVCFDDVAEDTWYYDAVSFIAARNITSGVGEQRFAPEIVATRGQFIKMLFDAYGIEPIASGENFSDAGDTWYTPYLAAAKQLNISSGVGDNNFAPDNKITRQEMFTLLYNALKVIDELPEVQEGKSLSDFKDSDAIAEWANEALNYLVENGVITGANGNINPKNSANRAEMARLFYGLLNR